MDDKKYYEKQEKDLSTKSTTFVKYLMRRGYLTTPTAVDDSAEKRRQEIARKAYHNTELLLKNYRDMVWLLESMPDQIASELMIPFASLDEIIDRLDLELSMNNKRLESRLQSITQSRLLINRINEAVSVLKTKPNDGLDLYRVIYETYINPETRGRVWDIYELLALSKRKYYSIRKKAITLISLRLWSAPNREINMWLDVLAMMENGFD